MTYPTNCAPSLRSLALRQSDENDKQAEIMKLLADTLTNAETSKDWAKVGEVNVVLRAIARALEAKDEDDGK